MRQKFVIQKDSESRKLIVQEYAELDKDILSFLCEERHDLPKIQAAVTSGRDAVIALLRTDNMYPPILFAQEIAEAVIHQLSEKNSPVKELLFDDSNYISHDQPLNISEEEVEEEAEDLEDLLDEDLEEDFDDKKLMKDFKSSIKIAEDETLDVDEET